MTAENPSAWGRIVFIFRLLQVRLRFLAVLLIAFAVVGNWEFLRHYWEKATWPATPATEAISGETEYWCPMCPGVVSDWPGKCGVCNMALVRRKRGEAVPLPEGILSRMQLSPYRLQLAGVQTSVISYRPLVRDMVMAGFVNYDERLVKPIPAPADGVVQHVAVGPPGSAIAKGDGVAVVRTSHPGPGVSGSGPADVSALTAPTDTEVLSPADGHVVSKHVQEGQLVRAGTSLCDVANLEHVCVKVEIFKKDLPFLAKGLHVEASCDAFPGHKPFVGTIQSLNSRLTAGTRSLQAWLEINNAKQELRPGMLVAVRIEVPATQIEPFRSMPTDPPPIRPSELRQVFVCPQHPDTLHDHPGRCPEDQNELEPRSLDDNQRVQWWCPMHPRVTADKPGCKCEKCKGMILLPRVLTFSPVGEVLALPESALVDTGAKKVVYIERAPGMFDGIEVEVGPRCGDYYPIIRGLEAGQRVATFGAFLIDAESRLNPNVAAGYFGAADPKKTSAP